ncbi:MAG: biopolymer transporter ExbD [Porphyromonas sp.]|nr:biopolymer transporter ExbD [Porphyromonas sp.]
MGLKRKTAIADSFSMASMTDVIFLLLIFFLVTSTIIVPNVIKVSLPSAAASSVEEQPHARLVITPEGQYYLGLDKSPEIPYSPDSVELMLGVYAAEHPGAYVSIHADEKVPYAAVVKGINAAAKAQLKVVLATKVEPTAP